MLVVAVCVLDILLLDKEESKRYKGGGMRSWALILQATSRSRARYRQSYFTDFRYILSHISPLSQPKSPPTAAPNEVPLPHKTSPQLATPLSTYINSNTYQLLDSPVSPVRPHHLALARSLNVFVGLTSFRSAFYSANIIKIQKAITRFFDRSLQSQKVAKCVVTTSIYN
jgi:hypothetical protein